MFPAAAHALGSSSLGTASGSCSCYAPALSPIVTILPGLLYTFLPHVGLSVSVLLPTLVLLVVVHPLPGDLLVVPLLPLQVLDTNPNTGRPGGGPPCPSLTMLTDREMERAACSWADSSPYEVKICNILHQQVGI